MKFFVAVFALGLIASIAAMPFTEEQQHKAQAHIKKCLAETKATPEDVGKLKAGDFSNEDPKVQCFAHCFLREAQMVDADGNQNREVIITKLSTNKDRKDVEALFEKCKNSSGSDACNKSFNAYKCYRNAGAF